MFKRATESAKVVPESVLSNRRGSPRYAQPEGDISGGGVSGGVIFIHC